MQPSAKARGVSLHLWHRPVLVVVAVAGGTLLAGGHPPLGAVPSSVAKGVASRYKDDRLQERATHVRPDPLEAGSDKPQPISEGCMIGITGTRSSRCLYGDPNGKRIVVLFGDSHAMQYFPGLDALAKRERWRLLVLTKRECTPAEVTIHNSKAGGPYSTCDTWRNATLERIEKGGRPTVVAMSGDTGVTAYGPHGEELSGRGNADALEAGYVRTLRRIRHAGIGAVVIRDNPEAPINVPGCVASHMQHLRACAFKEPHTWNRSFDLRAAGKVPGARLFDVRQALCPHRLCRAVINNALTYRDKHHLTATYAQTLVPWLEAPLKRAFFH